MKPLYRPEEVAVLNQYLDRPFPMRHRHDLLPGRSYPSIQQRLRKMRREADTLYRVDRTGSNNFGRVL